MARKKKVAQSEPAAAAKPSQGTAVTCSASSPSTPTGAQNANITKPNPLRNDIAAFIVRKFVKAEKIVYGRDAAIAYKLADRHPDLEFWNKLPIRHQCDSLVILWAVESRKKLTLEFDKYQRSLKLQRSIKLENPSPTYIIGEKVGEDFISPTQKPKSVLDFCRT